MVIDFRESAGTFLGTDDQGRAWVITHVVSGWRLQFSDPGDSSPTNAGLHSTLASARAEAGRSQTRQRR